MPAGYAVQGEPEPTGSVGELTERFSAHLPKGQWLLSGAYNSNMPTKGEVFIWHKPNRRWQVGLGLLAKPKTVRLLLNYELMHQDRLRPALSMGVGLQELGVGNPGVFAIASWGLIPWLKTPSSGYVGIGRRFTARGKSLGEGWVPLFGMSAQVAKPLTLTVQRDGRKWHGILSTRVGELRIGVFALRFKDLGVIVGWRGQ